MKKYLIIAALIAIAPLSALASGGPPPSVVPDAGSTLILLSSGLAGLIGASRFSKRR